MTARMVRAAIAVASAFVMSPLVVSSLIAQDVTLTGTVRSGTLGVVRGAVIVTTNPAATTITNDLGEYRLPLPLNASGGAALDVQVRALGFRPLTQRVSLPAGARSHRVDFTLLERAVPLEQVVVTGTAGMRERLTQPAVVHTIDAADIVRSASIANVGELLQGRTPGANITPSSGSSGQAQRIQLRGAASISLLNEPIVFIDGVRADSRLQTNNASGGQASSRLFDLNPTDIERIEVVNGPAASTLYGTDATGGVIQIFTKRGTIGAHRFSQRLALEYAGIDAAWTPPANAALCGASDVASTVAGALCAGKAVGALVTDNPLVRENAIREGATRSLSWSGRGGGAGYGYYLAFSSDQESGTLRQNDFARRSGRLNFDFTPTRALSVSAGLGVVRSLTSMPQNGDNVGGVLIAIAGSPLTVGGANNGWFSPNQSVQSIGSVEQPNRVLRVTPTVTVQHATTPWLSQRLTVGADVSHSDGRLFYPKNDRGWYGLNFDGGWVGEDRIDYQLVTADYLATAVTALGRGWKSDLSAGAQIIDTRNELLEATGFGLVSNSFATVAAAATRTGRQTQSLERSAGFLGLWQLSHAERFFLQLGARYDRHSTFGDDVQGVFLPKIGASYVLSQLPWLRDRAPFIGSLRLRGAYGAAGRSPIAGTAMRTFSSAPFVSGTGALSPGLAPSNIGNPDLRPERGDEIEGGFDVGFWHDRANLEFTAFSKRTSDLLLRQPLPPSYGYPVDPFVNLGEVRNSGTELAARAELLTRGSLSWQLRLAASTLRNRLLDLGDAAPTLGVFRIVEGRPLGALYSRRVKGVDLANGRAVVTDSAEYIGSSMPSWLGSVASTVSVFGRIRVVSSLEWKVGHRLQNQNTLGRDRQFANSLRRVDTTLTSREERLRRFGPYVTASGASVAAGEMIEPYLEDASFARWRELAVSYVIPPALASRLHVGDASLTLAARNLALWTRYEGDPEVVSYVGYPVNFQFTASDALTMPQPRRLMLRLELAF